MITADYYPKQDRLDYISQRDNLPGGGIYGDRAHLRAAELMMSGSAIVRIVLDSRMNRQRRHRTQCPFEGLAIGDIKQTHK